jgi:predicted metal-binding membrane protein
MTVGRRPRLTTLWVPLLLAAAVAWLGTAYLANGMDGMSPTAMSPVFFGLAWVLMMAAMMLPSVTPVAQAWLRVVSRQETDALRRRLRTTGLVGGYLLTWSAIGVPAYLLAAGLDHLSMEHRPAARLVGATILLAAGAYQLTPLKRACLRHCRSPVGSLLHYAGITGRMRDLRVGVRHGAYCLGCCWGLMAVLVLLGAMNLWLMALFTGIVFAEKIWRFGGRFSYGVGIVLGLSGLATLIA